LSYREKCVSLQRRFRTAEAPLESDGQAGGTQAPQGTADI